MVLIGDHKRLAYRRRRGFRYERDLALALWNKGFACIRGPASGAGIKRLFYPDLVAIKNGVVLVIEVKSLKKGGLAKVRKEKLEKMLSFVKRASGGRSRAYALLVLKLVRKGWRVLNVEELIKVQGDKKVYTIKYEDVARCADLRGLLEAIDGRGSLEGFLH